MNQEKRSIIARLNPAVPRHFLFVISGLLWTVAGVLLCLRAVTWLVVLPVSTEFLLAAISAALGLAAYFLGFFKVVQKNIDRIGRLPDRACVFAFAAWQGYIMIALMITIGITLRNSPIPKLYLAIPYSAMGLTLLIGSVRFFKQFLAISVRE